MQRSLSRKRSSEAKLAPSAPEKLEDTDAQLSAKSSLQREAEIATVATPAPEMVAEKVVPDIKSSDDADLSYFRLAFEGTPLRGRQVATNKLAEVTWQAAITGVAKQVSNSELAKDFHLNVFNKGSQQLLARVKPLSAKTEGTTRTIQGSLRTLSTQLAGARELRLDAFYDGEMLGASELSLYRAEVRLGGVGSSRSARTNAAGGSVATIGRASSSSALPKPSTIVSSGTKPNLPGIETSPVATATRPASVIDPALGVAEDSKPERPLRNLPSSVPQPTTAGLPAARGFAATTSVNRSPAAQNGGVEAENRYTFVGKFKGDRKTDVPETLRLTLRERAGKIFGTAEFGSLGTFSVTGRDFARGFELGLRSKGTAIRLTGSPSLESRGESLRGRFSIPSQQRRGAWSASRN